MASIIKRTWTSRGPTGHKVRKVAWGYTVQINGKQERKFSGEWTRDDAQNELAARLLATEEPPPPGGRRRDHLRPGRRALPRGEGPEAIAGR